MENDQAEYAIFNDDGESLIFDWIHIIYTEHPNPVSATEVTAILKNDYGIVMNPYDGENSVTYSVVDRDKFLIACIKHGI